MIETHSHGSVLELRLARPPVNALDGELLSRIVESVEAAPGDGAEAIVLSGRPGMFSAGLDVPALIQLEPVDLERTLTRLFDAMECLASSPVPVAAAITGHSPAGGAVLALFCDRRVMAEGGYGIGLTEVQVGIPLPASIALVAGLVAGHRGAEQICPTGALMDPEQALAAGFVHELAPLEEVIPTAVRWCESMLALPRRAMLLTRSIFRNAVLDILREHRASDVARFREEWFAEETQAELKSLVEQLKSR
jgi:enoyl-CoA hydratase/carnithine racemase